MQITHQQDWELFAAVEGSGGKEQHRWHSICKTEVPVCTAVYQPGLCSSPVSVWWASQHCEHPNMFRQGQPYNLPQWSAQNKIFLDSKSKKGVYIINDTMKKEVPMKQNQLKIYYTLGNIKLLLWNKYRYTVYKLICNNDANYNVEFLSSISYNF